MGINIVRKLPTELVFRLSEHYSYIWIAETLPWWGIIHDLGKKISIPKGKKEIIAVARKRACANSFPLKIDGSVEGIRLSHNMCHAWKRLLQRLYSNGYRAIRFEYETGQ